MNSRATMILPEAEEDPMAAHSSSSRYVWKRKWAGMIRAPAEAGKNTSNATAGREPEADQRSWLSSSPIFSSSLLLAGISGSLSTLSIHPLTCMAHLMPAGLPSLNMARIMGARR